jgi:outer membrane protein assembly factor BamB
MGFLMRRAVFFLCLLAAGCSSLPQLPQGESWKGPWTQFGASADRGQAGTPLLPPLTLAWTLEASGGLGTGSPLATGSFLFVPCINGSIDVIELANGKEWGVIPVHGWLKGTPVIVDSVLVYPSASLQFVLGAVQLAPFRPLWEIDAGMIEIPLLAAAGRVVAGSSTGDVLCLAAGDSAVLWRSNAKSAISGLAASDELLFVTTAGGDVSACSIIDGNARWRYATGAPFAAGPVAGKGWVCAVNRDGVAVCLNASDGTLRWTRALGAMVHAAPAASDEALFIPQADGTLTALSLKDGAVQWQWRYESVLGGSPVLAGSSVICVAMNGHAAMLDVRDGHPQWETRLKTRVKTSPIIALQRLIICAEDHRIFAFEGSGGR